MAYIKQTPVGTYQVCIRKKSLLPKPIYLTFDTLEQAKVYAEQLEALLNQGIVPNALLDKGREKQDQWQVSRCIAEYLRHNEVPVSDQKLLDTLLPSVAGLSTGALHYDWAEGWVNAMKREKNLAPSTIRHRHGALARCFDWMVRKHPEILPNNPLRLLKRGIANYNPEDRRVLARRGKLAKTDIERNRRLEKDEERRVLAVLSEREVERTFFVLALETAMRMRECYTLERGQVSLPKKTIGLYRSKNGDNRQVPLTTPAAAMLDAYMKSYAAEIREREGRLFPYWDGDPAERTLDAVTSDVSRMFTTLFMKAGVDDFGFHDLRHEATCRLYERTALSDILIARITGHKDMRMLKRYASLRGSDLAIHLW